jgi:hypothetical protein
MSKSPYYLKNPQPVVGPVLVEKRVHLIIIFTHMLRVPTITSPKPFGKRCLCALQRYVSAAHDIESQVLKAMLEMECHRGGDVEWII